MPFVRQTHFCIIYTLVSGAELFGGAPSEQSAWRPETAMFSTGLKGDFGNVVPDS